MDDPLSDIYRLLQLKGVVYFQRQFCSPWGMQIAGTGFAHFHVVTGGTCTVEVAGCHHACRTGDILFFPRSAAHTLSDEADRDAVNGHDFMSSLETAQPLFSEGRPATELICGHYEYRSAVPHPLFQDLPDFIHLRVNEDSRDDLVPATLSLLMTELTQMRPGYQSIVERQAEVLVTHVLRVVAARPDSTIGFHRMLADKRLSRAVSFIHRKFASSITLSEVASEAALSKSALAQQFKQATGMAPIEYLAKWRMLKAGEMLVKDRLPVAQVSERAGYRSDIAFSRAFKREYGVTPAQYRRHGHSAEPDATAPA